MGAEPVWGLWSNPYPSFSGISAKEKMQPLLHGSSGATRGQSLFQVHVLTAVAHSCMCAAELEKHAGVKPIQTNSQRDVT